MRILIYGAGVIGSLYAALFAESGIETAVYARGQRLESLRLDGLRYEKDGIIRTADVRVLDALRKDDTYDFIFLTVRENQVHEALTQLRENQSPHIGPWSTLWRTTANGSSFAAPGGSSRRFPARAADWRRAYSMRR